MVSAIRVPHQSSVKSQTENWEHEHMDTKFSCGRKGCAHLQRLSVDKKLIGHHGMCNHLEPEIYISR